MASNPFSQFVSGLQAPAYTGIDLNAYKKKNALPGANTTSVATGRPAVAPALPTASPGATAPTPTKITTPQTSALKSPAAQQYIDTQVPQSNQLEEIKQKALGIQAQIPQATAATEIPTAPVTSSTPPKPQKSSYQMALDSYLDSLKGSNSINEAVSRAGLSARREYNATLDASGGTRGGALESASLVNRRNTDNLADLGIAQDSATNAANLALQRLQFEKGQIPEAFNLSSGQSRYQFNPDTGETELVASGGPESQNTPASIQEYNFAVQQGYTGSFDEFKNSGGANNQNVILSPTEAQALGVPYGTTRGAATQMGITPTKPLTETQARDLTYGTRGQEANTVIDQLSNAIIGINPAQYALYSTLEPNALGNSVVPDEVRQVKQAQRNFLTAVLRRESGAVISPSEFATGERQYFPRPGDDAQTLAQKAQNRATAIDSFLKNAGQSGVQGGVDSNNPFSAGNFFGT